VLFRYNNLDNYYGINFSIQSSTGNLKLFSKFEGVSRVVDAKTMKLLLDKWYRIQIVLEFDQVKMFIQNDKIRENKLIFNKEILGLSRGGLGFATNGNSRFFVNGVKVDDYNQFRKEIYPDNKRSWNNLLKHLGIKDRKIYCRDVFDNEKVEVERCMDPHFYCQIRCDEIVPTNENILNFACFNDCVRTSNLELANKMKNSLKNIVGSHVWTPKKGDKCDYKPKGEEVFRMCTIKSVKKRGEDLYVKLSFEGDEVGDGVNDLKFPDSSLKKCGEALSKRNDCQPLKKAKKNKKSKK